MTASYPTQRRSIPLSAFLGFLLLCTFLLFSRDVIPWIQNGVILCGKTIIPTLFPCMIACDMLISGLGERKKGNPLLDSITNFLFGVPGIGMSAFFLGALCGFPIGTKIAADLYKSKRITQRELGNLLAFSNNTGPAFLIAGVGGTLFGSLKIGVYLYIIQLISAILCGILFSLFSHSSATITYSVPVQQEAREYSFVASVERSVMNALTVSGFVLIFSAVCGILSSFLQNSNLLAFIYAFLEVGGACAEAARLISSAPITSLLCACVAVNFGGLSVHLQAASFLRDVPYSFARYIGAKLTQTAIALLLTILTIRLFLFFS